jgi:hypothetical protein
MRYAIAILCAACVLFGGYIGHKFFPRTVTTKLQVPVTVTKEVVKLKQIVKYPDGKIVETEKLVEKGEAKTRPQPAARPDYKVGVLLPIQFDHKPSFQDINVSASRRLVGDVWLDAQYAPKRKELLLGISYAW